MITLRASLREHRPLLIAVGVMVACYAPWLNAGYVNLEYPFHLAARALAGDPSPGLMDAYFATQANPLGYSILLSLIYRVVGVSSAPWIARLPSMLGGVVLLASGWIWYRRHGRDGRSMFGWWAALIISHPMIAAFATHGTADLLPAALMVMAIVVASVGFKNSTMMFACTSVLMALAATTKYTVVFLGLGVMAGWLSSLRDHRSGLSVATAVGVGLVIPGAALFAHLAWMEDRFGVWISTCVERCAPDPTDVGALFGRLGGYAIFLGLFLGPVPLLIGTVSARWALLSIGLGGCLVMLFLRSSPDGELDFGALVSSGPSTGLLLLIGAVMGGLLGTGVVQMMCSSTITRRQAMPMLWAVLPALAIFSASRPTQRYLIPFVPLLLMLLLRVVGGRGRLMLALSVVGFSVVSLVGLTYLRAQGDASEAMARWLKARDLVESTGPGAICPHACHHWVGITRRETTSSVVALGPSDAVPGDAIHVEEMRVLGRLVRTYAVVPVANDGG